MFDAHDPLKQRITQGAFYDSQSISSFLHTLKPITMNYSLNFCAWQLVCAYQYHRVRVVVPGVKAKRVTKLKLPKVNFHQLEFTAPARQSNKVAKGSEAPTELPQDAEAPTN